MPDHSDDRVTVWLSGETRERMDTEHIDWRYESRSQWLREAAQTRMALEDALAAQGIELPEDADARTNLVETVVRLGVAAGGDDLVTRESEESE